MGILTTACPDWASGPWASCLRLRKTALRVPLILPIPVQAYATLEEQPEQRTPGQVIADITSHIGDEPRRPIARDRTQPDNGEICHLALEATDQIKQTPVKVIHRPTPKT